MHYFPPRLVGAGAFMNSHSLAGRYLVMVMVMVMVVVMVMQLMVSTAGTSTWLLTVPNPIP